MCPRFCERKLVLRRFKHAVKMHWLICVYSNTKKNRQNKTIYSFSAGLIALMFMTTSSLIKAYVVKYKGKGGLLS